MGDDKTILLAAVAYDPKVVTIWEGIREHFLEQGAPLDFALFSNYGTHHWPTCASDNARDGSQFLSACAIATATFTRRLLCGGTAASSRFRISRVKRSLSAALIQRRRAFCRFISWHKRALT